MITEMKAGHLKDIDKPREPFEVIGKIIPRYENENWTFTELLYEAPYLKSYQDEEDEEDEEDDVQYGNSEDESSEDSSSEDSSYDESGDTSSEETSSDEAADTSADTSSDSGSSSQGTYLGNFTLTAYCNCAQCCGTAGNLTASGTVPTAGRTVSMSGVPFGTKLLINGTVYTVEDLGTPYGHVDIYCGSHSEALSFGLQSADVYQVG